MLHPLGDAWCCGYGIQNVSMSPNRWTTLGSSARTSGEWFPPQIVFFSGFCLSCQAAQVRSLPAAQTIPREAYSAMGGTDMEQGQPHCPFKGVDKRLQHNNFFIHTRCIQLTIHPFPRPNETFVCFLGTITCWESLPVEGTTYSTWGTRASGKAS